MRSRTAVAVAVALSLAACGDDPDADPPPPEQCWIGETAGSCVGWSAATSLRYAVLGSSNSMCRKPSINETARCSDGCAVQGSLRIQREDWRDVSYLVSDPAVLCAETPEAKAGDACDWGTNPCLPTRAQLNADGTVAKQDYLACQYLGNHRCDPAPPPIVADYLQTCDAATVAQYGTAGVTGVVADPATTQAACLLAWDPAAQAITSGITIACIGDWQCPEGALCDDEMTTLSATTAPAVAVCKPGPRGALTPAMLAR